MNEFIMIFGDNMTIYQKFDEYPEETIFLKNSNGKVKLRFIGFAVEWRDYVDYDMSYAYIDNGKLYVVVHGLPIYFDKKYIEKYYNETLEQYIKQGYGAFFETDPGCPICMIVNRNGLDVIV